MKVKEAFSYLFESLSKIEEPYLAKKEAREILAHLLNLSPLDVYLYPEREVSEKEIERILRERLTLKPLPYILKRAYFFGRPFYLEEGVLIPRQETEILVEIILKKLKEKNLKEVIFLELGCGSGILSITLLLEDKTLRGFANDISDKALKVTKKNASIYGVKERLNLLKGNWFSPFKKKPQFHIILSNPPIYLMMSGKPLILRLNSLNQRKLFFQERRELSFKNFFLENLNFILKKGVF